MQNYTDVTTSKAPRWHPYFNVMLGLKSSNDPYSYAGGSVATGRAYHARQVKGDDPDKKGYPRPPGCGVGRGAYNHIKNGLLRSF
jgi:hypothetical protein